MHCLSTNLSASTPFSRASSTGRSRSSRAATAAFFFVIFAIAGIFGPAAGAEPEADTAARVIAKDFSPYWNEYDRRIGRAMRKWSCEEIGRAEGETVFYPFSGPDLPTVAQLFPGAGRYVLVSLQKAGAPPGVEGGRAELDNYLAEFRKAGKFYGALGFFRTEDLESFGMTGLLMAFAVDLGFRIDAVEPIGLDSAGIDLAPYGRTPGAGRWDSVRLSLSKGDRKVVVDYVAMDLRDGWLEQVPQLRDWIALMSGNPTLLKAASHLPQEREFSILRDSLLANAPVIVQDETGIDYGELRGVFSVRLYGQFTRSNPSFAGNLQPALAAAYSKDRGRGGVKPLPFRFGYEKNAGSALQVAVRGAPVRSSCLRPDPAA